MINASGFFLSRMFPTAGAREFSKVKIYPIPTLPSSGNARSQLTNYFPIGHALTHLELHGP